jgi:hypothetical protein
MQKWEYLTAEVVTVTMEVASINGESLIKPKSKSFLNNTYIGDNIPLIEFLRQIGDDGWEVVSTVISHTGLEGRVTDFIILLKRPKETI